MKKPLTRPQEGTAGRMQGRVRAAGTASAAHPWVGAAGGTCIFVSPPAAPHGRGGRLPFQQTKQLVVPGAGTVP